MSRKTQKEFWSPSGYRQAVTLFKLKPPPRDPTIQPYRIEPFDFAAVADLDGRLVPQPKAIIPDWLKGEK